MTVWNNSWLTVKCFPTVERVGQERRKQLKWSCAIWQPYITSLTSRNRSSDINYINVCLHRLSMLQLHKHSFFSFFLCFLIFSHQIEVSSILFLAFETIFWNHKIYFCVLWLSADTRGHPLVRVFWECQNSAQWQLFTLWQIHTNLHGGVSKNIFSDFIKLRSLSSYLSEWAKWCEAFCVSV